jgi:hypothetical protein
MSVAPSSIDVGRCYLTANNQVRRIVEITSDDRVNYEARGARNVTGWHPGPNLSSLPSRERFASDVERQVDCDWHPDYPER